jgi:2-dehydropantoate 2-reductase
MRVMVLGAGALGGYFGGRLLEGGADVAFLVRNRRRAQLARDGLVVESPFGDIRRPVETVAMGEARPGWDVVLLTCKAYDLDSAIAAIRPAVDQRTVVLPVLNGLSHVATLEGEFGGERVLGGLARIAGTLTPEGVVRHLNDWRDIVFGELDGRITPRVEALKSAFDRAGAGVKAEASADIMGAMWAKLVNLGSLAALTVMMRASVGEIARAPGGAVLMERMLDANAAIAAANGHPVPAGAMEGSRRAFFSDPNSTLTASMLRDLEAGGPIEADHILGFLLNAGRRAGVETPLLEAAHVHAKAYENRRAAGRLPATR